jgi:SAM-dependent methyltransferase
MAIHNLFKKSDTKADFLNSIPNNSALLEIGPFYTPFCKGSNVKYFDVLDTTKLIERALQINPAVNIKDIPAIDYVSPAGNLSIITETFNTVFSSHVIEHQWDFIDHLQKVSSLLNDGGKYYLIIPDKRYCFDYYNTLTTIADIINANFEKRQKHSVKSIIEHRAFITHNDPVKHWKGDHGFINNTANRVKLIDRTAQRIKNAVSEYNAGDFVDVHASYFTPDSFAEIINILYKLRYTHFKISRLYPTIKNSREFFVVLEKIQE